MRYILDNDGYVEELLFSDGAYMYCNGRGCTEYTGEIPTGYTSLDDWALNANIRAYYITNGNLVLDSARLAELESEEVKESEENRIVTARELYNVLSISEETTKQEFTSQASGNNQIVIEDAGEYTIPAFSFTRDKGVTWGELASKKWSELASMKWSEVGKCVPYEGIEIVTTNGNILPIRKIGSQTVSGVSISQNSNGSLLLNGKSTKEINIILSGTDTSTEMLFMFKENTKYIKSGLGSLTLALYSYDGVNRAMLNSGGNGTLEFDELTKITEAVLTIPSGTTLNNVTISPQIEIGSTATAYKANKRSYMRIDTVVNAGDVLKFDSGKITLNNNVVAYTSNSVKSFTDTTVFMVYADYCNAEIMYCLPSVIEQIKTMKITADRIDLEGYTTINGDFAIDEQGNMSCKNAQFTGGNIELSGNNESKELLAVYDADKKELTFITSKYVSTSDIAETRRVRLISSEVFTGVQGKSQSGASFQLTAFKNGAAGLNLTSSNGTATDVNATGITTPSVTQTSTEKGKKNFKKAKKTFSDVIKQGDIYEYNLKFEKDSDRKRLGFVIGDGYNVPAEVISQDEDGNDVGINLYSMCSVLWQAVKELTEEVERLKGDKK